ncbi:formyl transferase [Candidatus Gottesmanbacteria bacterium]|nr:formyl transferase [Candidatus Gottesmanbacteria bacterium]
MKILFLKNGIIPDPLIKWLWEKENNTVKVLEAKIKKTDIVRFKPDIVISYNYKYIIPEDILNLIFGKTINLHISYLPWNRGAHPNLWSFLKKTPKGVTIHLIDKGLDTGDILVQKSVNFHSAKETLQSSYLKLHEELQNLFIKNWDEIRKFEIKPQKQKDKGSIHTLRDFDKIRSLISPSWNIGVKDLLKKYESIFPPNKNRQ